MSNGKLHPTWILSMAIMTGILAVPTATFAAQVPKSHHDISHHDSKGQGIHAQSDVVKHGPTVDASSVSALLAKANQAMTSISSAVQTAQTQYDTLTSPLSALGTTSVTSSVYTTGSGSNSTGTILSNPTVQTMQDQIQSLFQQMSAAKSPQELLKILDKASQTLHKMQQSVQESVKKDNSGIALVHASQESLKEVRSHYKSALSILQGDVSQLSQVTMLTHKQVSHLREDVSRFIEVGHNYLNKLQHWIKRLN